MAEREYIEIITSVKGQEEVSKLKTEVDKLGKESQETGEQVEKFDDSITNATNKSKTLTQRLKELAHQFRATGQESNKSSTTILGAVKKYVAVGTAIAGLKKATNIFTAFDDEMRKVQATAGATTKEFEALRNQAKDLGATTSWSASEAAQAQFEFAKAGFTANEILKATPSILNTAIAGQLDLAEATSITAGALRMFKLDALESERVGDALAMTANTTTTDIRGLGESLKYAGLGATDFGLSLEQTLALLGTLGNNKIDSSMAGTGLRSVFSALKDKNKIKILTNLDVQLTEDGSYRNFLDILKDIIKKTNNMPLALKQNLMRDVFGEQGELVISALLKTGTDEIDDLIYKLDHAKGYSQKLAETFEKGLGGSFRGLNSAVEGLAISFIDNFAPAISVTVSSISSVINSLSSFFDWLNGASFMAITLKGAITGLTIAYATHKTISLALLAVEMVRGIYENNLIARMIVSTAITYGKATALGVLTAVSKIASFSLGILTSVVSGLATVLSVLTGPVGLIVIGIVGLGVAFYNALKKSETFRKGVDWLIDKFKELWGWIKKFTGIGAVLDFGKNVYNKAKNFFGFGNKEETQDIVNTIKKENNKINATNGNIPQIIGENTDYLLLGATDKEINKNNYIHNGYYLKGTKNLSNASSNIYTNNLTENKLIEKSPEEKIVELLTNIKDLLSSKKSNDSKVQINVTKESNEDILSQVVEDLTIALGNI